MAPDRFNEILDSFEGRRVVVFGDFLLDEYIVGNSARVSREAPIVVIDYERTLRHPGGAANAAWNASALGGVAVAVGIVGEDREGDALVDLLVTSGVDTSGLIRADDYETPVKLRIMAGEMNAQKQQVARVDRTSPVPRSADLENRLGRALESALGSCDAVLVSDYGTGLVPGRFSDVAIERGRHSGVPVVVDSRFNVMSYKGASVATPNEVEALSALGDDSASGETLDSRVERLRDAAGLDGVIVTRGRCGMLAKGRLDTASTSIPIVGKDDATDVTGAGDTVSATVALSLAAGADLVSAAWMATFAASIVVMKRGTATAGPDEMRSVIRSQDGPRGRRA